MPDTNSKKPTVVGELRQIGELIEEATKALKEQRDTLKAQGMSLPPSTMNAMTDMNREVERLNDSVIGDQTELSQLRSLADTSAMINSSLSLDQVLSQAMDVVIDLTGAERGFIILKDPETGRFRFRIQRDNGSPQNSTNGSEEPQISQTIIREVLQTGEPLLADNAYKDERLQGGLSIAAMTLRSVLCSPLKYKQDIIGVVYVDNRLRAGVFEEREKNLLAAFANQASVAIENARLYEGIQQSLVEISEMKGLMDNVFASIGSGVITTDAKHRVLTFNQAAANMLSRSSEDTIGEKLGAVLPGISADLDIYLAKIRDQGNAQVMEGIIEVEDRGRIAISMKLSPLRDADNAVQGVAIVMDDLTEQREREEALNVMKRYLPPELVENINVISQIDLGGERREVTCMFVDVRSVASFPADFRPQQIMEQLNVYFDRATHAIHDNGGVIDKYMGTEIMALFNTQLNPMEDHATRALETALSIRDIFIEFYEELGINPEPHYYRIGINTGEATLGNVGSVTRREFSAIGDTINLSKRLEENAEFGQIIIGESTRQHIEAHTPPQVNFRLEEREPVKVKGRQQKTRIYEVFKA